MSDTQAPCVQCGGFPEEWDTSCRIADDPCGRQAALRAELERVTAALRQIEDPSYVGNYPPEKVVEIYRTWAKNALAGGARAAQEGA